MLCLRHCWNHFLKLCHPWIEICHLMLKSYCIRHLVITRWCHLDLTFSIFVTVDAVVSWYRSLSFSWYGISDWHYYRVITVCGHLKVCPKDAIKIPLNAYQLVSHSNSEIARLKSYLFQKYFDAITRYISKQRDIVAYSLTICEIRRRSTTL